MSFLALLDSLDGRDTGTLELCYVLCSDALFLEEFDLLEELFSFSRLCVERGMGRVRGGRWETAR